MMNERTETRTVVFAMCGSFCSFAAVLPQIRELRRRGWAVLPLLSASAAALDTRFGTAAQLRRTLRELTGREPLTSLQQAEPLGPQKLADAMVIAPCTGTTLALLARGISGTAVTLAAKSLLRGGRPIVLAPSTNDGLAGSAPQPGGASAAQTFLFCAFRPRRLLQESPPASKAISRCCLTRSKARCAACSCSRCFCKGGAAVSFPRGAHMYGIGLLIFFLYLYCPAGNAGTFRGGYSRPQPGKRGGARWNGSR